MFSYFWADPDPVSQLDQPASQPASQPVSQPAGQPAGQPASQPLASQPASQLASQLASQPASRREHYPMPGPAQKYENIEKKIKYLRIYWNLFEYYWEKQILMFFHVFPIIFQ